MNVLKHGPGKFGAGSLVLVGLLFIGIALLANSLLRGAQLDLTADKLFTLSDGTRNILRGLKEPVNVYLFFSDDLATPMPEIKNHGTRVRELLESMAERSGGKLTLKVIDPQPYSEEEDRANELGVQGMPVSAGGEKLYLGIAATNSTDGKEAIAFLDPKLDNQLEYDIAKLIHKLGNPEKPVVGWLSSLPMGGGFDMQTGRPNPTLVVYGQIEQLYSVRTLEPTLTTIDEDIDVLVLVHPKNLSPAALYAIDQYALRGGHLLVFLDPNSQADQSGADPGNPMAQFAADKSSRLEPLLSAWGVDYKSDQVVADLERGLVLPMREGEQPTQQIAILGLNADNMTRDVIAGNLDSINVITAGSLKALPADKTGGKLKFEPLIHTSQQAGLIPAQRFSMMTDPASLRDGFKPDGQHVLAARVSGEASSAFADGPPAGVTAAPDALKASAKPLNIVLVADTDLLADYTWVQQRNFFGQVVAQPFANNGELVWNALDNLAGSNDLISIRGRASYLRPFDRVEELRRSANAQFRATAQQLETQLAQTEETLTKLQTAQGNGENAAILSADQLREIERFESEKLRIRKELRAVNSGLDRDIKSLGMAMKILNIAVVPAIFAALALLVAYWHRRRRQAIAMLRKGGTP
jgi:ABC-type uncharacterized transport system involved in gliding motility auxiliary subunit